MKIGYARVSTDDQNLDLQKDALKKSGCARIYEEHRSGRNLERPELEACVKALRLGDTLSVWRLDRLGRSLPDLIKIIGDLQTQGIGFESLTERVDTTTATGELVFHVFAALAQFERNLIRERTRAGLVAARARGRKGGRPPKMTASDIAVARTLRSAGELSMRQIAERMGVSRSALYEALTDQKRHSASPDQHERSSGS